MNFLVELHPKIVHFPIAFLMLYPLIELLYLVTKKEFFNKTTFLFLIVGVIGSVIAVLSGNKAIESLGNFGLNNQSFKQHQTYANIIVWYFTVVLVIRFYLSIKKKLKTLFVMFLIAAALIGSYLVFQTGNYGGKFANEVSIHNSNNLFEKK